MPVLLCKPSEDIRHINGSMDRSRGGTRIWEWGRRLLPRCSRPPSFCRSSCCCTSQMATFALLRQMGLANFAALLGGILYALNGTFAWFADSPILPVAFLPLLLLGVERAFIKAREKQRGGWAWIAIALAYSIYAGFPETAYLDGLLVLAWTLYRFFVAPPDARWSFARKVSLGAVSGLLIATPLIVSFLEYQNFSAIRHSGWSHLGLPKISFAAF